MRIDDATQMTVGFPAYALGLIAKIPRTRRALIVLAKIPRSRSEESFRTGREARHLSTIG
jgi:hypothetical protein